MPVGRAGVREDPKNVKFLVQIWEIALRSSEVSWPAPGLELPPDRISSSPDSKSWFFAFHKIQNAF